MNNISDKEVMNSKLSKWYEENKARYNLQDKFAAMLVWQAAYKPRLSEFEHVGEIDGIYPATKMSPDIKYLDKNYVGVLGTKIFTRKNGE